MGWGDIFSDPGIVGTVASAMGVPTGITDLATGTAQAVKLGKSISASNKATADYGAALASQKKSGTALSENAARMMREDTLLRQSLLEQTGDLGAKLRSIYSNLGDLPAVSPETIAADYGALREQSMGDFANLVKGFNAQQYATDATNLGGARNPALEDYQMNQNLQKFAPIQQQLDTAAYAEAVKRSTDQSTALSTNRNQILQNIISTLSPQLEAESKLYRPDTTAGLATSGADVASSYLQNAKPQEQTLAKASQTDLGNLNATIAKIFGVDKPPQQKTGEILWSNSPLPAPSASTISNKIYTG